MARHPFNKNLKNYLYSLRHHIFVAFLLFGFGIAAGYWASKTSPLEAQKVLERLREIFQPIAEGSVFSQILFIFLKNSIASFLVILGGLIFGIFPILSIISNGEILGLVSFFTLQKHNLFTLISGLLPHGFIEIPCFLISAAMGLKIGQALIKKIFKKRVSIKAELNSALEIFLKVILISLFLAAVLEVLVSSKLLEIAI